jgi:hypothetical protein
VGQLSFYSAEASPPRVTDLAGALCGPGQAIGFGAGTAARLSVPLGQRWRALALASAFAERGVDVVVTSAEDGGYQLRTAFRADLVDLAASWSGNTNTRNSTTGDTSTGAKSVPARFVLDGVTLRLWALAAGCWSESGYLLGLDPANPRTHQPLVIALVRAGVSAALLPDREGGPALRVYGARRLARLVELVGAVPQGVPGHDWPTVLVGQRGRASIGA